MPTIDVLGLDPNKDYDCTIAAQNAKGTGPYNAVPVRARPLAAPPVEVIKSFTPATLADADLAYTRADSVATYRDKDNILRAATANQLLTYFDKDQAPSVYFDVVSTNKCQNRNYAPTLTTGGAIPAGMIRTPNGNQAVAISCGPLPAEYAPALEAAGIKDITNLNIFCVDNTGQAGYGGAAINGTVTNLNLHSGSAWMLGFGYLQIGGTLSNVINDFTKFQRVKLEAVTPLTTSDRLEINCPPGGKVYFILNQLEEWRWSTKEILVAGAAAQRKPGLLRLTTPGKPYWGGEEGFIAVQFRMDRVGDTNRVAFAACGQHNNQNDTISMEMPFVGSGVTPAEGSGTVVPKVRRGGVTLHGTTTLDMPQLNKGYGCGIAWRPGEVVVFSGGKVIRTLPTTAIPDITLIDFGSLAGLSPIGHLEKITIGNKFNLEAAGLASVHPGDNAIITAGQSNAARLNVIPDGQTPPVDTLSPGRAAFRTTYGDLMNPAKATMFVHGALGGSAVMKKNNPSLFWLDQDTNAPGPVFEYWERSARLYKSVIQAIHWDQGEAEVDTNGYKTNLVNLFTKMRAVVNVPVIITIPPTTNEAVQTLYRELIAEYDWIYPGPERHDLEKSDSLHYTPAAYATLAQRLARVVAKVLGRTVSGSVLGPSITAAYLSGTSLVLDVQHDGGNDLVPSSALEGFTFVGPSGNVAVTAAVRTSATRLTLTLASAPAGGTLYHARAPFTAADLTKLVRDNQGNPLRAAKIVPLLQAAPAAPQPTAPAVRLIGGNSAGPTFSGGYRPFPDPDEIKFMAQQGIQINRQGIKWEDAQPTLNGPLDPTYMANLDAVIAQGGAYGMLTEINLHNYCRRPVNGTGQVMGDGVLTTAHLLDFWQKITNRYKNDPNYFRSYMMNEPYNIPGGAAAWKAIAEAVSAAIRAIDPLREIIIPGYQYQTCRNWVQQNDPTLKDIADPNGQLRFSAHHYFDTYLSGNNSGSGFFQGNYDPATLFSGYPLQLIRNEFYPWLVDYLKKGNIGETGVPNDPIFLSMLTQLVAFCIRKGISVEYWAYGYGAWPQRGTANEYPLDASPYNPKPFIFDNTPPQHKIMAGATQSDAVVSALSWSISAPALVAEGQTANFSITRNGEIPWGKVVGLTLTEGGTASPADLTATLDAAKQSLKFVRGVAIDEGKLWIDRFSAQTIVLPRTFVTGDGAEGTESYSISLAVDKGKVSSGTALVTVSD